MFSQKNIQTNPTSQYFLRTGSSLEKSFPKFQKKYSNRPASQSLFHAKCHMQSDKQNILHKNQVKPHRANVLTQKFNSLKIKTKVEKQIKQHKKQGLVLSRKIKLNLRNQNIISQNQKQDCIQIQQKGKKKGQQNYIKQIDFDKVFKQNTAQISQKFRTQSSFIRRSLQKFQKTIEEKIQKILVTKKQVSDQQIYKKQENLLAQKISRFKLELQKRKEQIKGLKSVNTFLTSQNYKIVLQNNILKEKILEAQHKDFSQCIDDQSQYQKKTAEREEILIIKKQVQELKLLNQRLIDQNHKLKIQKNTQTQQNKRLKQQIQKIDDYTNKKIEELMANHQQEIKKFKYQICELERQTNDRYIENINLATRLSKIQNIQLINFSQTKLFVKKQNTPKNQKKKSHSIVSISIKSNKSQEQSQPQQQCIKSQFDLSEKNNASSHFDQKRITAQKISYKPIKSQILSNRILYYTQVEDKTANEKETKVNKKKGKVSFSVDNSEKSLSKKDTLKVDPSQCLSRRRRSVNKAVTNKIAQQSLKKTKFKSAINFYSISKINQLKIIRQSISLKFEAFKYTFELFQNQMIKWPSQVITQKQITKILLQYPFFLDEVSIQLIINYCDPQTKRQIHIGTFTNKIRQFIQDYDQMLEQDQIIIQRKIIKRWKYAGQEIMNIFKRLEDSPGIITKDIFIQIFSEMKFQKKQIQYLLSQIVAISKDVMHMKYLQYFTQIFVLRK